MKASECGHELAFVRTRSQRCDMFGMISCLLLKVPLMRSPADAIFGPHTLVQINQGGADAIECLPCMHPDYSV